MSSTCAGLQQKVSIVGCSREVFLLDGGSDLASNTVGVVDIESLLMAPSRDGDVVAEIDPSVFSESETSSGSLVSSSSKDFPFSSFDQLQRIY